MYTQIYTQIYIYTSKLFFELCLYVEDAATAGTAVSLLTVINCRAKFHCCVCFHAYRQHGAAVRYICRQAWLQRRISCCPGTHAWAFCIVDSLAANTSKVFLSAASYSPAGRRRGAGCF